MLPAIDRPLLQALSLPEIRHLGIVVRDLDEAIRAYAQRWHLGPWLKPRFAHAEHLAQPENLKVSTFKNKSFGKFVSVAVLCFNNHVKHGSRLGEQF